MFNSIGYFNYRYFVSFLLFVCTGMMYGAMMTLQPFLLLSSREYADQLSWERHHNQHRVPRVAPMVPHPKERMLLSLSFMMCAAVGMAVLLLACFHVYLVCTAQTTIEFHANWTSRRIAKSRGQVWKNPYCRRSWSKNSEQVFGCDRHWLLSILIPRRREPDVLPIPVPGHELRKTAAVEQVLVDETDATERDAADDIA
jgi:palmitoyltransferase